MVLLARKRLSAKLENLPEFMATVTQAARTRDLKTEKIYDLEMALEEAMTNICAYAYPEDDPGDVEVACGIDDHDLFFIEIKDFGRPFDTLSVQDPDITAGIEDRKIGGLGIFLIKKLMDRVEYCREQGANILRLTVNLKS